MAVPRSRGLQRDAVYAAGGDGSGVLCGHPAAVSRSLRDARQTVRAVLLQADQQRAQLSRRSSHRQLGRTARGHQMVEEGQVPPVGRKFIFVDFCSNFCLPHSRGDFYQTD